MRMTEAIKGRTDFSERVPHVVLLGDSIFDNAFYVSEGRAVIDQLRDLLRAPCAATLLARDGDRTCNVVEQLDGFPSDATHVVISVGGNDALSVMERRSEPVTTLQQGLTALTGIRLAFRQHYRAMLRKVLALGRPVAVCTIYDSVPGLSEELKSALCLFNDTIAREATAVGFTVIDLRPICDSQGDYASISPIEPSVAGGAKIAKAIFDWVAGLPQ